MAIGKAETRFTMENAIRFCIDNRVSIPEKLSELMSEKR